MRTILLLALLLTKIYSDYTQMKISDFVNIVAAQNNINIATDKKIEKEFDFFINKEISGQVNIEVLKDLLDQNGYILVKKSDDYYIIRSKDDLLINKLKIYKINYADTTKVKSQAEKILSGYFKNIRTVKSKRNTKTLTPMQERQVNDNNSRIEVQETETKVNYSINILDNKHVAVSYKDDFVPIVMNEIIKKMDAEPKRIRVKLKIYEVNSEALEDYSSELGLEAYYGFNKIGFSSNSNGLIEFGSTRLKNEESENMEFGFNISSVLTALVKDGKASIKSEPNIIIYEGNMAKLTEGKTYPIKQDDTTVNNETTTTSTTYTNIDTGLILNLRFNEYRHGMIYLKLDLNVNNVESYDPTSQQIITTKRSLYTDLMIEPDYQIDMAGLTHTIERSTSGGIPILKDIPLIGGLFEFESDQNVKNMLVIQLTTELLTNKNIQRDMINQQRKKNNINNIIKSKDDLN